MKLERCVSLTGGFISDDECHTLVVVESGAEGVFCRDEEAAKRGDRDSGGV